MAGGNFEVDFYLNARGQSELREFLHDLRKRHDKTSKIAFKKITDYIEFLERSGFDLRPPVAKHIEGAIWELRPLQYRIFYAYIGNKFILLHYYVKKSDEMSTTDFERAKNNYEDYGKRYDNGEFN